MATLSFLTSIQLLEIIDFISVGKILRAGLYCLSVQIFFRNIGKRVKKLLITIQSSSSIILYCVTSPRLMHKFLSHIHGHFYTLH